MKTTHAIRSTLLALAAAASAACGGGGDGNRETSQAAASASAAQPPAPAPEAPPPAATHPLNLALKQGDFLEFMWQTEQTTFAQPSTTTLKNDTGRFKLTLGASVLIQGQQAYPLSMSGDPGTFAPRWTHFAVAADGSLLGSRDGASLTKIYDAVSSAWTGGGTFVDFGQSRITVTTGRFSSDYNDVPAVIATASAEDARCAQILGEQVCDDDATRFAEREYYKPGIGPIGSTQHIYYETDSGGFFTSTTIDKTIELVESSLAAIDGTVFARPPWDEVAPMLTPRSGHAAAVFGGRIWAIGGLDANNRILTSTELYDPVTNAWITGPPLPGPLYNSSAVAIGTSNLIVTRYPLVVSFSTTTGWQTRPLPLAQGRPFLDATDYYDPTLGDMVVAAWQLDPAGIQIGSYDVSENTWYSGGATQPWRELFRSTVERVDQSLFVIGGFGMAGGTNSDPAALDTIMEFDLTSKTWIAARVGALNVARENLASAVHDGKIYAFGGNEATCSLTGCTPGPALRAAEVFDPATDRSTKLKPMLHPRSDAEAVTLNGLIYVLGGRNGGVSVATVERLTPQ